MKPKQIHRFFWQILHSRHMIDSMARREVAGQYRGSLLGVVWTFLHPLVLIFVFWFVFSVGFKQKPMDDVPFVVWLTAGMMPWFLFADILQGATNTVVASTNLIKKTLFPSQVLPVVKSLAGLVTHGIFLLLLTGLLLFQKMDVSFFYLQFIYYAFCLYVLVIGASWITASLNVFIRDVGHVVGVVLQVGFWMTPIFWDIHIMPAKIQLLLKLNPMYYIVQGYRDSFIYHIGFWQHPYQTLYFWCVALLVFSSGVVVFSRLKPLFADVL